MLEKQDLQAIAELMKQQKTEIIGEMDNKLNSLEERIDGKLNSLEERIDGKLNSLEERMDNKLNSLEERMDNKLNSLEERMDGKLLQQKTEIINEVKVLIENEVTPKFNLLAEGQQAILEQLAPKSRLENLEDEVNLLKIVIKQMNEEINALKAG